jgi:hypothetical protein
MLSSLFLSVPHTHAAHTRCVALTCALLVSAALSACGGGSSGSTATTAPATPSTTPQSVTDTTAPVTVPKVTSTAAPVTTTATMPSGPTVTTSTTDAGSRTVNPGATASYNSCADNIEVTNPGNVGRVIYQRYVVSASGSNGDVLQEITTTNQQREKPNSLGYYYVRSAAVLNTADGLPIPDIERIGTGGPTGKTISSYQFTNGQVGLVSEQQFDGSVPQPKELYTDLYSPVFFDRLFTLSAGQEINQTRIFTRQPFLGETFKAQSKIGIPASHQAAANTAHTVSQRIKFLGVTPLTLGPNTYSTCKFEIQNTEPPSAQITTEWYLEGRGMLVQAIAQVGSNPPIRTQVLETAAESGKTFFPRNN